MGLIWDLMQSSEISEQQKKAKSLEKRLERLEDELIDTRGLVYFLMQEFGSQLPATQPGQPLRAITANIVGLNKTGVDRTDHEDIVKQCQIGEKLRLVRVPGNAHEGSAVAVLRQSGEPLGFLPRDLAVEIAPRLDFGSPVDAEISKITGGGWLFRKPYEVRIKVTKYRMCQGT